MQEICKSPGASDQLLPSGFGSSKRVDVMNKNLLRTIRRFFQSMFEKRAGSSPARAGEVLVQTERMIEGSLRRQAEVAATLGISARDILLFTAFLIKPKTCFRLIKGGSL